MYVCGEWISRFHTKLFKLSESVVKTEYFNFLSKYKLLILVFNMTRCIKDYAGRRLSRLSVKDQSD